VSESTGELSFAAIKGAIITAMCSQIAIRHAADMKRDTEMKVVNKIADMDPVDRKKVSNFLKEEIALIKRKKNASDHRVFLRELKSLVFDLETE
jgi:hypothetical protein